eukprot:949945-Rhodomonas_salina.1
MSTESPAGLVGSQDPMEPQSNTGMGMDPDPLPATEQAGTTPHSETEPAPAEAGPPADEAAPEDFDTLAADLQVSLDELDMSHPGPAQTSDSSSELTPCRVVHFETEVVTPISEESRLGFGGAERLFTMSPLTYLGKRVGMTPIVTWRALDAAEIKIKLLERALHAKKPHRYSLMSTGSQLEEQDHNYALANLEKPLTFKGDYTELYSNVLNWIHSIEWYLLQCQVKPEDYASYVRSYLSRIVQAWMDGRFPVRMNTSIPWSELHEAREKYIQVKPAALTEEDCKTGDDDTLCWKTAPGSDRHDESIWQGCGALNCPRIA